MKVNFLFWNTNRKKINREIALLSNFKNVDLLFLAEYADNPSQLLVNLNEDETLFHYIPGLANKKFQVFSKFPPTMIRLEYEERGLAIWSLKIPRVLCWNLCGIHSRSKLFLNSPQEQFQDSMVYSQSILRFEKETGNESTILFGDFNQNPFEEGLINIQGYNAVMSKNIALKGHRSFRKKAYPFFYNPSWGNFGDTTPGPPGSYYFSKGKVDDIFWHIYDQVLVRPSLISNFVSGSLEYVTEFNGIKLTSLKGVPNSREFSDHLPLSFEISF